LYILLLTVVIIIETEDTMNTRRNHPASPNRNSERDMMKENQNENLEKAKESMRHYLLMLRKYIVDAKPRSNRQSMG